MWGGGGGGKERGAILQNVCLLLRRIQELTNTFMRIAGMSIQPPFPN